MWQLSALWYSGAYWEDLEYFAEAYVICAALVELLCEHESILKGQHKESVRKSVERGATIALILGLALGMLSLVRTNSLYDQVIACLYQDEQAANNRAERAENRADEATRAAGRISDKADRLGALLEEEQQTNLRFQQQARQTEARLAEATSKLSKATADLDLISRRRTPRTDLLREASAVNAPKLRQFTGQRIAIISCSGTTFERPRPESILPQFLSTDDPIARERNGLWRELNQELFAAKWDIFGGPSPCSTSGPNMRIVIDPMANPETRSAANALASILRSALLLTEADLPVTTYSIDAITMELLLLKEGDKTGIFILLIGNKPFQ